MSFHCTQDTNWNSNLGSKDLSIAKSAVCPHMQYLQLKLRPLFLHLPFPLPFLSTYPLDPPIDPPQLHRESRSQFLQSRPYSLHALHFLPIRPNHILLRLSLLAKDIPMPSQKDVIPLVMQRHNLPALQLRLRRKHRAEEMCSEEAEWRAEVVQD